VSQNVIHHFTKMSRNFIGVAADHTLSETVAAVHRALVGSQDKSGLFVLVLHARDNCIIPFSAGVLVTIGGGFHGVRHAEPSDGVVFPIGADQIQIIRRDANGILISDMDEFGYFVVGQVQWGAQLFW
jgi:hypothetical protein